jgi:putative transposase
MTNYRRLYQEGGCYFFTLVSYQRQFLFTQDEFRTALRQAIIKTRKNHPFEIIAWVLLPDHLHCIWQLPEGDNDYSTRWALIKRYTSEALRFSNIGIKFDNSSKIKKREAFIWQRRFWEHLIRDQNDFNQHFDYIHFNPIKHGLVENLNTYPFSSFHRYEKEGIYCEDWISKNDIDGIE